MTDDLGMWAGLWYESSALVLASGVASRRCLRCVAVVMFSLGCFSFELEVILSSEDGFADGELKNELKRDMMSAGCS